MSKIANPLLASALLNGFELPNELRFNMAIWELVAGPLQGRQFVGGYYSRDDVQISEDTNRQTLVFGAKNVFDLQAPNVTFFGLEIDVYRSLLEFARTDISRLNIQPAFELETLFFDSSASILRDGSIIAPIQYLRLIGVTAF